MDSVQFQKNGVQNRNKIRGKQGEFWLTIPVTGHLSDLISEKHVSDFRWNKKHWNSLVTSYSKAPFWNLYAAELEDIYMAKEDNLGRINEKFLFYIVNKLGLKTKILRTSDLEVAGNKSDLVLNICKILNAKTYISGSGAKGYLIEEDFIRNNIFIEYKESKPPVYEQFNGEFIPGLSILDMMFNVDIEDLRILLFQDK